MKNSEIWKKTKEWLISSDLVEPNIYDEYIKVANLEELCEEEKVIVVKSELSKWYLENLAEPIKNNISDNVGKDIKLTVLTKEEFEKEKEIKSIVSLKKERLLVSGYTFENFITGSSNINALNAAKSVIENLGTKWNPLFIYGDSGLGKTHLLKAISNEVSKENVGLNIKYFTSSDFRKNILDSLMDGFKEIEMTKTKMNDIDVILIDDIQFLANSGKTNEIFFNIFNSFVENNKQIVLSSDKFPEQLNGFDKRMVSRFSQGLSVKIEKLDNETSLNIIEYKCKIANINLSSESKKYISSFFGTDVRKIEGIINKIEFYFIQNKHKPGELIDVDYISKILEDYSFAPGGEITVQKIKDVVSQYYGVNIKSIDSSIRVQNVVKARHVAMYLTGELLKKNYSEIGLAFGGKDHTTVLNAFNKINKFLKEDKLFRSALKKIKKDIVS
ncbi:chromosomal replication initiator protein DnaA [Spiroplasma turonicum]|uniref:Chromosomal replication initiator protein DnaA n=1 Tax=Spiroplasma turonicum TaxID=216946 RepID=A0A0K1P5Q0_9MOLU|nr:chromosomal replication initiator protein DnaA [Spiroplasma turonicum]AKU79247.1 chromosomal replication initiation protein [Spiroplasma turonicum]ALX70270.1 chromosomal replication initiation protein [Spiroplasma turonicum]